MTRYTILICLLLTVKVNGQNCPTGYEERTVKCNGQFVKKCVPIGYSCSQCWAVQYPPCPGNKDGGLDFYSSYEKALTAAQKEANGNNWSTGKCLWYDNRTFKIYLDDSKQCNTTFGGNSAAINDLKNKIIPFLKRYKAEISNYRRYFSGKPYKPGAIVKEYESMLKQAEDNVKKLENYLINVTEQNLSEIETAFNDIQNEENKLQQTHSNYESYINNNNLSTGTTTQGTSSINNNTSNNQQFQNQVNAINQQYQTRLQNNEQFFNTLQTGIQNISDILAQNAQRKAEERQRQFQLEQQRREQKRQEQLEEERKRQEEDERINNEMVRQFSIDSVILSNNNLTLKTSSINPKIDSVYYIGYKRQYDELQTTSILLKIFVVYRYSDGTFPLFSNVVEKSKFENNINRYGITLLIGFFQNQAEALKAMDDIQTNSKYLGVNTVIDKSIRKINFLTTSKAKDDNFWNQ